MTRVYRACLQYIHKENAGTPGFKTRSRNSKRNLLKENETFDGVDLPVLFVECMRQLQTLIPKDSSNSFLVRVQKRSFELPLKEGIHRDIADHSKRNKLDLSVNEGTESWVYELIDIVKNRRSAQVYTALQLLESD